MHRVDPAGRNLAHEIEYRHHRFTVILDTVRSGGRRSVYLVLAPDDTLVGEAQSLREAAEVINEVEQGTDALKFGSRPRES